MLDRRSAWTQRAMPIRKLTPQYLRNRAARCRVVAELTTDPEVARALMELSQEFEAEANRLETDDDGFSMPSRPCPDDCDRTLL